MYVSVYKKSRCTDDLSEAKKRRIQQTVTNVRLMWNTKLTHYVFSVDMRSVGIWYGHTMTFSSEHCCRNTQDNHTAPQQNPRMSVRETHREDLDYWGLKNKQLSKSRLDQYCYVTKLEVQWRQVRIVRSGRFFSSFGSPLDSGYFGSHLKRCWNHRGDYVSIHYHDLFQHELVHHQSFNWDDDKEDECVCWVCFLRGVVPLLPSVRLHVLWQSSFAGWFSLCCFTDRATFMLCLISSLPESFCSRDWSALWHSSWSASSSLFRASQLRSSQFFFLVSV